MYEGINKPNQSINQPRPSLKLKASSIKPPNPRFQTPPLYSLPFSITETIQFLIIDTQKAATMAFSPKLQLLFFFLHLFSLTSLSLSNPNLSLNLKDSVTDVHELLPQYNLPIGLLPGNVKSYSLSKEDNSFTIELTHHCYVHFLDQPAYYDTTITGKLGYGKVYNVDGIQAKKFFLWVSVTGMEVDAKSNMIEFHAGGFTEKMPAEVFQTIPSCRDKGFQETELASI